MSTAKALRDAADKHLRDGVERDFPHYSRELREAIDAYDAAEGQGELRERLAAVAVQKAQIISFPDSSTIDLVATVHSVLDSILPLIQRDRNAACEKTAIGQWEAVWSYATKVVQGDTNLAVTGISGSEEVEAFKAALKASRDAAVAAAEQALIDELVGWLDSQPELRITLKVMEKGRGALNRCVEAAVAAALEQASKHRLSASGMKCSCGSDIPRYEVWEEHIRSLITQPQADALAAERNRARLEEAEWWNTERLRGRPQPICLCRDTDRCPRCKRLATLRAAVDNNQKG